MKSRKESPAYFDCMETAYASQYDKDSLEFCRFAYGNSSGVFDKSDAQNFQLSKITDQNNLEEGFSTNMF